ncbi:MAG: acetolactate synthase small subunit [Desulfobacteraceae bacterium]|nr:acetolactate synthase small subunit [Desulfobacteraceae bacterium]
MSLPTLPKRRAILAFVLNRAGVLNKISSLIRRKMYNVDTLTVCATKDPSVSRMTLTLREDSDAKTLQVVKQLEKMTEVISAKELDTNQSFWREVAVIKFEADEEKVAELGRQFPIEILDHQNQELFVIQIAGTSQRIDDFIAAVGNDKVFEAARSGFTALEK